MITVDPGVKCSYYAIWSSFGLLVEVGQTESPGAYSHIDLVIEKPQIYQGRKQKGDPNDLIDLAMVVGAWRHEHPYTELVKPRQWKGQVPKAVMTKRILSKLTDAELAVLGDLKSNHNVVDAVGIGLWKLGRL